MEAGADDEAESAQRSANPILGSAVAAEGDDASNRPAPILVEDDDDEEEAEQVASPSILKPGTGLVVSAGSPRLSFVDRPISTDVAAAPLHNILEYELPQKQLWVTPYPPSRAQLSPGGDEEEGELEEEESLWPVGLLIALVCALFFGSLIASS